MKKLFSKGFCKKIVINSVKVDSTNIKSFGKQFTNEEVKKYLDPYGFLNNEEIKELKLQQANIPQTQQNINNEEVKNTNNESNYKIDIKSMPKEFGLKPKGPEPTRYGDWERNGKCVDF